MTEIECAARIAAAVSQETEACAKVAESLQSNDTDWDTSYWNQACNRVAAAIRARSAAQRESE